MKDVKILITNVNWDGTDDFKEPIKLVVPKEAFENSDDESFRDNIEEYIADEISNISGFCHDGFSYEIIIDNYLSTRSLLEKAIAIKLEHYVFSNFSIEPAEEIQEYLKDAENPMVFSLYGVWEDGENIEYHFDMSDVEKAIINDDLSITIDGKKIEILVPIKRDN